MLGAVTVTPESMDALIKQIGAKYNVEPALIKATIRAESNWDVNASRYEKHKDDASWGLMQVMLATAKWILKNDNITISQLVSPYLNIEAGTAYLAYNLKRYKGNLKHAIAAYNAGSARFNKDGSYVNQSYVDKVYGFYQDYKALEKVGGATGVAGIGLLAAAGIGMILLARR